MESVELFALGLAVVLGCLLAVFRRSTERVPRPNATAPIIEVTQPDIARQMLIEHADTFSDRPANPFPVDFSGGRRQTYGVGTAPHGPLWRALRCNITANILHPSRLRGLAPLRRKAVQAVVAALSARDAGDEVVVRDSLRSAVFAKVAHLCFGDGVDLDDMRLMERELEVLSFNFTEFMAMAGSRMARLLRQRRWLHLSGSRSRLAELFLPYIAASRRHRARLGSDDHGGFCSYVDTLIDLRVPILQGDKGHDAAAERALTDQEVVTLVWEFLSAGTESTVACVEFALAYLVTLPELQKKLHAEVAGADQQRKGIPSSDKQLRNLPLLHAVVLETLRLHPPVGTVDREASAAEAADFASILPAGTASATRVRFSILPADIGRDSSSWKDPDEFRPDRFLTGGEAEGVRPFPGPKEIRMMPFGAGRRGCPGAGLGIANIKLFLATLVREFEWAPPAGGGGKVNMTEKYEFFTVLKTPLRARISPR